MTPELLYQRRWAAIGAYIESTTAGAIDPVIMPPSEGGGFLIIQEGQAYHFYNIDEMAYLNVSCADTCVQLECRAECFSLNQEVPETARAVVAEILFPP